MNCTQKQQLVCFPKVRVYKPWFRHFNDHKDFRNEGTVHLFSLMALFSYANFRSNERVIYGDRYMEAPGQWICKLGALPRILRVHSKAQALELMEYFRNHGFLTFEILDEEKEILRFTIADWKEHCTHLQYNYYSYKGSGFFFFPLPVGRLLLKTARKEVGIVFSELDAIMDMWLHTILNDPQVRGSEYMPVVYYSNMRGMPLLSYTYLARRWGWSKSRVGRFMLKAGEYGIISRVSFSSSRGSVISMCRYHRINEKRQGVNTMNLKEAFRFQNKLQSMMTDAQSILGNNGNITKVQNTYLRHKVMAEAEDEVTMEAPSTEYSENITEMAEFLLFLLDEREKLSAAIHQAKVSLPLGAGLDGEVSLNGKRQEIATLLRHMAGLRNGEVLISNGGVGYRFNNEGNQVSYRCDVKRVTTINFDRNKIRKMCANLSKKSDETSATLDAALVNTPVEYEAPFNVNETFAEAFEAHMSALS